MSVIQESETYLATVSLAGLYNLQAEPSVTGSRKLSSPQAGSSPELRVHTPTRVATLVLPTSTILLPPRTRQFTFRITRSGFPAAATSR